MGKMLETLKRMAARRQPPAAKPGAACCPPSKEEEPNDAPGGMPFIEVGGRSVPLEASPEVLAVAPAPRAGITLAGPGCQPVGLPRLTAPAEDALTVQFRPVAPDRGRAQPCFAPQVITFHRPAHPISRQYQRLAETLTTGLPAGSLQVLGFTAAAPQLGTTTVVLNLAVTLARSQEHRVVLIDANRERPALAERLGLAEAPGLEEVLAGSEPLEQALQATGLPGLLALTVGHASRTARAHLTAEALRDMFDRLRERGDLILIDTACWDSRPDAAALASVADAVYVVCSIEQADTPQAAARLQAMRQQRVPVRGLVVTGH
jgi:Mrp family chromosome partitioning ATPase